MTPPPLHEIAARRQTELLAEAERRRRARQARPPGGVHLPAFLAVPPGPGRPRSSTPLGQGQPC